MTGAARIPAEGVEPLRDGLRSRLAAASRRIADRDGTPADRERTAHDRADLRRLDALRALLEGIGWDTPPREHEIDLAVHGRALGEALRDQLSVHADMLRELDRRDPRRKDIAHRAAVLRGLANNFDRDTSARSTARR